MRKRKLVMMILSLLVAGTGLVFTACSSDDSKQNVPPEPSVKLDPDTIQVFEGLTVKFQMLNADSLPVTTFKEGENITFKLVVTNDRDTKVALPNTVVILGNDAFHIYTSQGADIGLPWDARYTYGLANQSYEPGQSRTVLCDAFGEMVDVSAINPPTSVTDTWCIFFKTEYARKALPKGSYYTQFEINLNNGGENPSLGYKGVMCRKEFRIE